MNHDGIAQAGELHGLLSAGVVAIGVDYKESRKTDSWGNQFKYRSQAYDARGSKVASRQTIPRMSTIRCMLEEGKLIEFIVTKTSERYLRKLDGSRTRVRGRSLG